MSSKCFSFILPVILLCIFNIKANERKFTYVYQSDIMGKEAREIELTTTARIGNQSPYFAALDNRMEFEIGLSKRLQTAFYINFTNTTISNGAGENQSQFEFRGISSEWKYQFTNPYKDALGFALYSELGLNTDEVELETKIILDKRIRKTTLALNLTYEPEWYLTPGKANVENNFVGSFGFSQAITADFSAGVELRNHNIYTSESGWESSVLFGGPVLSYSQHNWWITLTVMPQIVAFKGKSPGSNLSLHDFEKFESRMIFSFQI